MVRDLVVSDLNFKDSGMCLMNCSGLGEGLSSGKRIFFYLSVTSRYSQSSQPSLADWLSFGSLGYVSS